MGANQSGQTRSVNMENQTPIGVIDVSDEVVQRLKDGLAKNEAAAKQKELSKTMTAAAGGAGAATETTSKQNSSKTQTSDVPFSYQNPHQLPQSRHQPQQHHYPASVDNQTITAMDVRRQKDLELKQNDLYWRNRLNQLEQTLNKTNQIMEKEYTTAIDDVRQSFTNAPPIYQLPACQSLKANLIACYRVYSKEPLKCAEEVAAFTNCVDENRIKKLDTTQSVPVNANQSAAKLLSRSG